MNDYIHLYVGNIYIGISLCKKCLYIYVYIYMYIDISLTIYMCVSICID